MTIMSGLKILRFLNKILHLGKTRKEDKVMLRVREKEG